MLVDESVLVLGDREPRSSVVNASTRNRPIITTENDKNIEQTKTKTVAFEDGHCSGETRTSSSGPERTPFAQPHQRHPTDVSILTDDDDDDDSSNNWIPDIFKEHHPSTQLRHTNDDNNNNTNTNLPVKTKLVGVVVPKDNENNNDNNNDDADHQKKKIAMVYDAPVAPTRTSIPIPSQTTDNISKRRNDHYHHHHHRKNNVSKDSYYSVMDVSVEAVSEANLFSRADNLRDIKKASTQHLFPSVPDETIDTFTEIEEHNQVQAQQHEHEDNERNHHTIHNHNQHHNQYQMNSNQSNSKRKTPDITALTKQLATLSTRALPPPTTTTTIDNNDVTNSSVRLFQGNNNYEDASAELNPAKTYSLHSNFSFKSDVEIGSSGGVSSSSISFTDDGNNNNNNRNNGKKGTEKTKKKWNKKNNDHRPSFFFQRCCGIRCWKRLSHTVQSYWDFIAPQRRKLGKDFITACLFLILPSLLIALILFYGCGNPPHGKATGEESDCDEFDIERIEQWVERRQNETNNGIDDGIDDEEEEPNDTTTFLEDLSNSGYDGRHNKCIKGFKTKLDPSASWWLLFIGCRLIVTFFLARASQLVIINVLTFRLHLLSKSMGTTASLFVSQSQGWPYICTAWGLCNLLLLTGRKAFAQHWFYYQPLLQIFTATNPSGDITMSPLWLRLVSIQIGVGIAVTIKRLLFGNFIGTRVTVTYRAELARSMQQLVLVTEVATLSLTVEDDWKKPKSTTNNRKRRNSLFDDGRRLQQQNNMTRVPAEHFVESFGIVKTGTQEDEYNDDDEVNSGDGKGNGYGDGDGGSTIEFEKEERAFQYKNSGTTTTNLLDSNKHSSTCTFRIGIEEMLEDWEEPELLSQSESYDHVTILDVLSFRRALSHINSNYLFTAAFGNASTREECIKSSQVVFDRFVSSSSSSNSTRGGDGREDGVLDFKRLCQLAELNDGSMDPDKVKDLIRVFRPSRNGKMTKLDFVRSVDRVYKTTRLLIVNIANTSQIDRAYERLLNAIFYTLVFLVVLGLVGLNVRDVMHSLTAAIVGFSFAIGAACSKYLEGIMLVLVRKPYDIGDRVCIVKATDVINNEGPPCGGFIVEKVDLYTTTVRLGSTKEYATFSNASLSDTRIVNLRRCHNSNVFIELKFSIDITPTQRDTFKKRILQFIKDRPRQWIKLNAFRPTKVHPELQIIEYVLVALHRESWQDYPTVQQSRGDLFTFALELQTELKIQYMAPRLPIDICRLPTSMNTILGRCSSGDSTSIINDQDIDDESYTMGRTTTSIARFIEDKKSK